MQDNVGEEEEGQDVGLEVMDVGKWDEKTKHWVIPDEQKLKVLRLHHNSFVARQWARH